MDPETVEEQYRAILSGYLAEQREELLLQAHELGRSMVQSDIPIEDIATLHESTIQELVDSSPDPASTNQHECASEILQEVLMAYGLAFRERLVSIEQSRKALEASEQRFRDFASSASDWLWEIDTNLAYTYISKGVSIATGMQVDEFLSRRRWEFIVGGTDSEMLREHHEDLRSHRPFRDFVYTMRIGDGRHLVIREAGLPRFDDKGRFLGYRGTSSDITARTKAEEKAKRLQERLGQALEAISEGFALFDADMQVVLCNSNYKDAYPGLSDILVPGVSLEEILQVAARNQKPELSEEELNDWIETRLRREILSEGEDFKLSNDRWYKIAETRTPDGGVVKLLTDVTERRQVVDALQRSEARFRQAFESAGHGIALVATDGRWLDVNGKVCEMLGYTSEELLATNFQTLTHEEDLEDDLIQLRQLLRGEIDSYQMEKRYIRKDGSTLPAMLSVGLVRDSTGSPLNLVSQIVDLSDAKNTEAKLVQAQKMEAVGNLTGGIAHDFNNILSVILGNLQLLERRVKEDEKLSRFAKIAIEASQRGADLTRQLLAFSRHQELEPKTLNANDLVANMDKILRRTLGDHIDIKTDLQDALGAVRADPAQLESAILNLSINARDAMPGGGKLLISTSNEELDESYLDTVNYSTPGPHVCISITDTGTGIAPDTLDKIFEPFFTTKEVGKGTGLGLSMVFGFVKQSNGHIQVYSEVGHGTRFRIYLPRIDYEDNDKESDIPEALEAMGGTEIILLVEDEREVREMTGLLLEDLGYKVIAEPNGPKALEAIDQGINFDLVLTDMIMPYGLNGHELGEKIRNRFPDIPILLMSGYPRDAFAEGRNFPLLQKPFTNIGLAQFVRKALDARKNS